MLTRKTLGGLQTDLRSRVLRADGRPLPGLYAAGEVAGFGGGGMHGYRSLEGTFLGGCLFSGRPPAAPPQPTSPDRVRIGACRPGTTSALHGRRRSLRGNKRVVGGRSGRAEPDPSAQDQHDDQRPQRLQAGGAALGQPDAPGPGGQLHGEPERPACEQDRGGGQRGPSRRTPGARRPRRQASAGQQARAPNATVAAAVCAADEPPPAGRGLAATRTVARPPSASRRRPGRAAGRSAAAVAP